MTLQALTTFNLFYFIMVEGPVTYDVTLHLRSMTTLHDFEGGSWGGLWTISLGSHNVMAWSLLLARV